MNLHSLVALAQNISLLLAAAVIFDLLAVQWKHDTSRLRQAIAGVSLGAIGIVIMNTPWSLMPGVIIDSRSVLLACSGLFLGPLATALAAGVTGLFRIYQGGAGAATGVLIILASGLIGILWRQRHHRRLADLSWGNLLLFGLLVHVAMLLLLLTLPWGIAPQVLGRSALPVLLVLAPGTALLARLLSRHLHRERLGAETRESEKRYRVIFDNSPLGVIHFDEQGVIRNCNRQFVQLMGSTREKLIGFNTAQQSSPLMRETLKLALAGQRAEYEDIYTSVTGNRTLYLRVIFNPVAPGKNPTPVIATLENVTERKRAEEKLSEYRKAVEHSSDIMAVVDRNHVYRMVNQAMLTQRGLVYDNVIGHTVAEVMGEEAYSRILPYLEQCFAGEEVYFATQMHYVDKGLRDLELEYLPIKDEKGVVERVAAVIRDVTERKQVYERLRKNEQLFTQAEALANIGFWEFDRPTGDLFLSRGVQTIHDLQEPRPSLEYLRTAVLHPEDRQRVEAALFQTLESKCCGTLEYRIIREDDGCLSWVRTTAEVECDDQGQVTRIYGATQDISAQRAVENELRESEKRFRMLYMDAPIPYQSLDENGDFIEVNNQFCKVLGYEEDEIIGRNFSEFLHPDWQAHFRENFPRFKAVGEVLGVEFQMRKRSGDYILVSFTGRIGRDDKGAFRQTHCVFRDISKEREEEEVLIRAKEAAEIASKAKSEFLANMSHELRTPLNGIMGMLQLIGMTASTAEQKEYVDMALQSCRRLTSLMSDILDLSRIEAGKMDIRNDPFDFQETLHTLEQVFGPSANQIDVAFSTHAAPDIPKTLLGDAARLQQVLNNLAGNALKFTKSGEVRIEAWPLSGADADSLRLLISVSDTGIGIPEDKLGELFSPFTQVEGSYTRHYQGAGLGLSIVRRLLQLMGGNACVKSEEGLGTTIYCSIPFGVVRDNAALQSAQVEASAPPLPRLKVLLAEDDPLSQAVAARQLEKLGCEVQVVPDGEKVLDSLRQSPCDVLLMDVQMPVMDGVEATRRIRAGEAGTDRRTTPIIALTAYAMTGDREKFLQAGMDDYLAKPLEMEHLRSSIARLITPRQQ